MSFEMLPDLSEEEQASRDRTCDGWGEVIWDMAFGPRRVALHTLDAVEVRADGLFVIYL